MASKDNQIRRLGAQPDNAKARIEPLQMVVEDAARADAEKEAAIAELQETKQQLQVTSQDLDEANQRIEAKKLRS